MKPSVAITLLIAGLVIVAMPPISDYFWRADAIRLVERTGMTNGTFDGKMEMPYRVGCFVAGITAILMAVYHSIPRVPGKALERDKDFV